MIAVYHSSPPPPEWSALLPDHVTAVDRRSFERFLDDGYVGIVFVTRENVETLQDWLRNALARIPPSRIVIIAEFEPAVVAALWSLAPLVVHWDFEDTRPLVSQVNDALAGSTRCVLAALHRESTNHPFPVGTALRRVVDLDAPPVTSVAELTREIGVSEGTLRIAWRTEGIPLHPKTLIDWVLLLRALDGLALDGRHRTVADVASGLGLTERSLRRVFTRLTGQTCGAHRAPEIRRATVKRFWQLWPCRPTVGVREAADG